MALTQSSMNAEALARFRKQTQDYYRLMVETARDQVDEGAGSLVQSMQLKARRTDGDLVRSILRVRGKDQKNPTATVVAGGKLTTKDGYDYALANEYGTVKMKPQPFFFNTAASQKAYIEARAQAGMERTLERISQEEERL